ncbi:Fic family protein [Micromonospora ureilytica]|uniref:Fic family protein n=1 Tax=Micromonospora ureilytica TaxID=709868 RepID=A0ABS0JM64_9ACTN|nr:Fic/DOC family N-terminal domain-containing protein [Micromonospora ureilytica]MBG6068149.1 Fic family protein [Micromonospora ureilytica]
MEAANYQKTLFGYPTRRPGDKWAFTYYRPEMIPRDLTFETDTVLLLSEADNALGHLQGLGRLIPQPELLVGPFLTREAIASSRIEGTKASLSDVLKAAEDVSEKTDDIAEVGRYLSATRAGLQLIKELPLSVRLIKAVHEILMEGVRGEERLPGEIRHSPVWIGGSTPNNAIFVPPLHDHLPELLTDWERFVNERSRLPLLVRSALMHYQFETIHPFLDGNGRIGRLLIVLQMIAEQRLTSPLLYLSGYLETHRREYYDHLQAVRETGAIQSWIQFFCRAVKEQSEDAVARAAQLVELREKYYKQAGDDRSRVNMLIPLMFQNPFMTAKRVQSAVGGTPQGARNLLERAVEYGWLQFMGAQGRGGRLYYAATEVLEAIESPTTYERPQPTYGA